MSPKNTERPTINDVAHLAGVSKATVSRVLTGSAPVNRDMAERVQQAIKELNYIPSATAQALADRRTKTLGFLVLEIAAPYFVYLLRGIEHASRELGYRLLINTVPHEDDFKPLLGEHNTDGLLVFAGSLGEDELRRLHDLQFPLVLVHQTPPDDLDIPMITIENKAGTRQLIDHLIETHHCRQIAFLRGPDDQEDSYWRELGYRQSLEAHRIAWNDDLIGYGGFDTQIAQETTLQWIERGLDVDAIFAGDDEAAAGVLAALRQAGKRVPDEIVVVGFDDDYVAHHLTPGLTTVRSPIEQIGREAVHQLVNQISGKSAKTIILPTELVIRESCGCHPLT